MGELVDFPSNGTTGIGYLAVPASGAGPGLVVIQEWWGLVDHIKDVCDRFADEGFVALAPDLYRGETTTEPDEAGKLMMALNLDRAVKDMDGAVEYLIGSEAVTSQQLGVTGYCMGGGLALALACQRPDAISACAPFYGIIPWPDLQPDYDRLEAAVQGHFAENDGFFNPEMVKNLEAELEAKGKEVELFIHPGVDHAFFNDTRDEVYHEATAAKAWGSTVDFLRANVS
jgi:carboxymethylenebutenolidase